GLAREAIGAGPAQFVNAVLRKVAAQDLGAWLSQIGAAADDETQRLAVTGSHPAWIVRAFRQSLAETPAGADDMPALVQANNSSPAVHLVLRPGLVEPDEIHGTEPGRWTPTAPALSAGDPHPIPAVRQARAGMRDE